MNSSNVLIVQYIVFDVLLTKILINYKYTDGVPSKFRHRDNSVFIMLQMIAVMNPAGVTHDLFRTRDLFLLLP